jgi:hypothetical protein
MGGPALWLMALAQLDCRWKQESSNWLLPWLAAPRREINAAQPQRQSPSAGMLLPGGGVPEISRPNRHWPGLRYTRMPGQKPRQHHAASIPGGHRGPRRRRRRSPAVWRARGFPLLSRLGKAPQTAKSQPVLGVALTIVPPVRRTFPVRSLPPFHQALPHSARRHLPNLPPIPTSGVNRFRGQGIRCFYPTGTRQ